MLPLYGVHGELLDGSKKGFVNIQQVFDNSYLLGKKKVILRGDLYLSRLSKSLMRIEGGGGWWWGSKLPQLCLQLPQLQVTRVMLDEIKSSIFFHRCSHEAMQME